jgi:hypothetical protein
MLIVGVLSLEDVGTFGELSRDDDVYTGEAAVVTDDKVAWNGFCVGTGVVRGEGVREGIKSSTARNT